MIIFFPLTYVVDFYATTQIFPSVERFLLYLKRTRGKWKLIECLEIQRRLFLFSFKKEKHKTKLRLTNFQVDLLVVVSIFMLNDIRIITSYVKSAAVLVQLIVSVKK